MRKIYLVLFFIIFSFFLNAQVTMTTTGNYSQNFNSLVNSGSNTWTDNSTIANWYAQRTGTGTSIVADAGSNTAGNLYSYGTGTSNERALGSIGSGNVAAGNFAWGLLLQNTSGTVITDVRIGYIGEQWRNSGAAAQTVQFFYKISSSIITSLDPNNNGSWIPVVALHLTTPIFGGTASSLDGNNATNQSGFANVIIPSLVLNPNEYIMIKWDDPDHTGADHGIAIDDFTISWVVSSNTITTGSISTPPFVLTNCSDTETGTVDFTSTGIFNAGNIYTAQLSDDLGAFGSPVTIGTLASTANSGTINITIPAGTTSGPNYRVRVISSDPSVIGTESSTFQIIQQGIGGCASSSYDYYRSKQSGDWDDINTWESSPDNINWISATKTPTYQANIISIRSPHVVTIDANVIVDQVLVFGGATLNHSAGTLTVEDGTGYDIDVNGVFVLLSASNAPQFSGGVPQINIATGGILRVSAAGLTGAGTGVNDNRFVYNNNSILEYTLNGAFSTNGVTYFPGVAAGTIPIFRVTANSPTVMNVGSTNPTIFNGLFQLSGTATVRWQNSGDKTFRNGIDNTGTMDFEAASIGSAKFRINGTTARLSGSGALLVPTTGGLEIGNNTTVTLDNDKTITGNVTLLTTNTIIDLGSNDLTITGTITNSTVSSYVRTSGTGVLTLNSVDAIGKLYPIGRSTINPLFIQSPVTTSYSARIVEPINPPIYNDNEAVLRTWYLSSPANSPNATISFGYSYPADAGPLYSNAGPVEVGVHIGTWNIHQSGLTPTVFPIVPGTFIVTASSVNYFNGTTTEFPFVIANNGAILSSDFFIVCRSQKQNGAGIINWQVQDINSVNKFEVQRSVNGGSFQSIASILPVFNQTHYQYIDQTLKTGTSLYRIKVNRNSGGTRYSNTVAILNNTPAILISSISPNPVSQQAEIVVSSAKEARGSFIVYDLNGRHVKRWQSNIAEGTNYIREDMTDLPAGVYHLLVSTGESRAVLRFVKQ